MLRKPGDLPQVCPRTKKVKRLAMRDTLHGSRPNLQQREPDGRLVPTPPDVWDKGASTKRCARRKKNHNYTYTYTYTCSCDEHTKRTYDFPEACDVAGMRAYKTEHRGDGRHPSHPYPARYKAFHSAIVLRGGDM